MKQLSMVILLIGYFALVLTSSHAQADSEKNKTTTSEKSPEKGAKPDLFVVPDDATPAELTKFVKRLMAHRMKLRKQGERLAFYRKKARPVTEAAEKILASSDATDAQRKYAAGMKYWGLSILSRGKDPAIIKAVYQFPEELAEMGLDDLAERADLLRWSVQYGQALSGEPGVMSVDEAVEKIKNEVSGKTDRRSITLVSMAIHGAERKLSKEKALSLCGVFEKLYTNSDGEEAAKMVRRIKGLARRMQLLGSAMEISGTLLDGEPFDWSQYKGKVVLVQFWATWCAPCRGEIPNIKKYLKRYQDRGFEVVSISLDSDRERLEKFVQENELPWPTIFEEGDGNQGWDAPMALDYAVSGIPTLILLDKDGKVVCERARGKRLKKELVKLLGPLEESDGTESH